MKTIGLIGGTSWTSTIEYYRYINEETARHLGGLHSARLVLASIDFFDLEYAIHGERWDKAGDILGREAARLEVAGADAILLCSNLVHKLYDRVQEATSLPIFHIADALAEEIRARQYKTVALLGAKPTMEETFYAQRITEQSGARVMTPSPEERSYIDSAIFDRMCRNIYTEDDRKRFQSIIEGLRSEGAEAVILGCTELPVLLRDSALPLLNSTQIHSLKAVAWAINAPPFPRRLRTRSLQVD